VLTTIDRYAYDKSILMNVGDEKGALLDAAVRRANPKLALELWSTTEHKAPVEYQSMVSDLVLESEYLG
jgi:hypothetical protein